MLFYNIKMLHQGAETDFEEGDVITVREVGESKRKKIIRVMRNRKSLTFLSAASKTVASLLVNKPTPSAELARELLQNSEFEPELIDPRCHSYRVVRAEQRAPEHHQNRLATADK